MIDLMSERATGARAGDQIVGVAGGLTAFVGCFVVCDTICLRKR